MGSVISITNRTMLRLCDALGSLDACRSGRDEIINFEFAPGVSLKLAQNAVIVERAKVAFDRAVRAQAKQAGLVPGENLKIGADEKPDVDKLEKLKKFSALQEATEEMKDSNVELTEISLITLDELLTMPPRGDGKAKLNQIPQSIRVGLIPIIKDPSSP